MAKDQEINSVITQLYNVDPVSYKQEIINELRKVLLEELKNIQPQPEKEYLSRDEVCEMLKVSKPTLHNWAKEGVLIPFKIGNRVLYLKSEIEDSLNRSYDDAS